MGLFKNRQETQAVSGRQALEMKYASARRDILLVLGFTIINIILLVMGMFMNMLSIVYIMVPILLPIVSQFGMHPVQFGIMMIMNLGIGLLTPPVGQVLFVGASISGRSVEDITKALIPQMMFMVIALIFITFVPAFTMWLPGVLGYV